MTTYNELLGVAATDPAETIKQRYKLLSLRVHPDKGGSTALMQLVRHAYENSKQGKGGQKLTLPAAVSIATNPMLERALKQIKEENAQLKARLQREQKNNPIESQSAKRISQLEKQIQFMNQERKQLILRKETEQAEKLRLAKELKRLLIDNEIRETQLQRNYFSKRFSGRYSGRVSNAISRGFFWLPSFAFVLTLACLLWLLMNKNAAPVIVSPPPLTPTAQITENPAQVSAVQVSSPAPNEEKLLIAAENMPVEPSYISAPIQSNTPSKVVNIAAVLPVLNKLTQSWQVFSDNAQQQPFMAIKGDNGAMISLACGGKFRFYTLAAPLSVSANLTFLGEAAPFYVYQISYGEGASAQSWLQSRRLEIHSSLFTNAHFADAFANLQQVCLAR